MSSKPPYIDPEDVAPEVASAVLALLNSARTPEEIATAIEYPGEPDIGVRLAERLLQARDRLGGFTDLRQVRSVRLIGPERFTEIVAALAGPRALRDPIDQLRAEVAALRSRIAVDGRVMLPLRRLTLQTLEPNAYFGQPVSILATLTDGEQPAVDVPVTFIATRGALRASDGYTTHQGHLITARTGVDGIVRLTASPTTKEELTPLQQDALAAMLGLLDPKAPDPQSGAAGLRALAQQYSWEINLPLRQAIDIYVREFRPMLLDTVNLHDNLAAWAFEDSAVLAFAPVEGNGDSGSSVSATATLHLRVRNWIPAFLQAFVDLTREVSTLADDLRDLTRGESDQTRLVNSIYARASKYVGAQWGNVGEYVGRKVAEASIRTFLDRDLSELPLDTRVATFPALDLASKTLAGTDARVIRALAGTRTEIAQDVERKTGQTRGEVSGLFDRFSELEGAVKLLPDTSDLTNLRSELLGSLANARISLSQTLENVQADLAATQLQLTTMVTKTELTTALASKADTSQLTAALATKADRSELTSALATKADRTELAVKADRADLTEVNRDISALNIHTGLLRR